MHLKNVKKTKTREVAINQRKKLGTVQNLVISRTQLQVWNEISILHDLAKLDKQRNHSSWKSIFERKLNYLLSIFLSALSTIGSNLVPIIKQLKRRTLFSALSRSVFSNRKQMHIFDCHLTTGNKIVSSLLLSRRHLKSFVKYNFRNQ